MHFIIITMLIGTGVATTSSPFTGTATQCMQAAKDFDRSYREYHGITTASVWVISACKPTDEESVQALRALGASQK